MAKKKTSSQNWSKTKQIARKMSDETWEKEEIQEKIEEMKALKFKEKELKIAQKLFGPDFTTRRSARGKLLE